MKKKCDSFTPRGTEKSAWELEKLSHYLFPKIIVVTWRVFVVGITRASRRCKKSGWDTLTS